MTLGELFSGLIVDTSIPENLREAEVTGVTSDSREAESGFVYVCIKGASFDGHEKARELLEKGTAAVVTQTRLGTEREINVSDTRKLYPELLSAFYGRPTSRLKIGAVTGTNGKTTIANLCAQITRMTGHKTGVIGTLGVDTGEGLVYSHNGPPTTPEPRKLYRLFKEMTDVGTEYCFLEASSQGLAQNRFAQSERFTAGAFTNLTRDHLDYHGTMENYFAAKLSLFDRCKSAVVNIDDDYGKRAADYCHKKGIPCFTVSVAGEADYYTEMVKLYADRSEFILTDRAERKSYPVRFPMTGYYNVSNAIIAAVMCKIMDIPLCDSLSALQKCGGVAGRLETLYSGDFTVIRDYAHTADGLEKLLSSLKPLTKGRLICLFGAAGERDAGKRPEMGAVCAKYADLLYVTTDSPRHEDPQKTIDDVAAGIPQNVPHEEYTDRKQAVLAALNEARAGDVVALCGKGHEDYQAVGDEYLHFDEKEIVEEWERCSRQKK